MDRVVETSLETSDDLESSKRESALVYVGSSEHVSIVPKSETVETRDLEIRVFSKPERESMTVSWTLDRADPPDQVRRALLHVLRAVDHNLAPGFFVS